jgi:hypothetical protein
MKAGSVLLSRISAYLLEHPDARVHFVGHSAGAIYCAALLEAAEREHVTPSTVTFLAPAIKITDFQKLVVPHLATLKRFTVFDLSDQRELRDRSCKFRTIMYHKSLLYLVSKAIEQPVQDEPQAKDLPGDVALLGLEKFKDVPMTISSDSAFDIITRHGGNMYFAPSAAPLGGQTDACAHGDFAKDVATMDSIARIVTGRNDIFPYWKAPSASPSSSGVAK